MSKNFIKLAIGILPILGLAIIPTQTKAASTIDFVTTWQTTSTEESITIPTEGDGYDYTVDWGNGNIDENVTGDISHTYSEPGIHTVSISGDFPRIKFDDAKDPNADKLMTIEQWGDQNWQSMEKAFYGANNLQINATDSPNLSEVENMYSMFFFAEKLNADLSNWDTSNVKIMGGLFGYALNFNGDITTWDTSNVQDMGAMFYNARQFNQDISGWNTNNVMRMDSMFRNAIKFNQPINTDNKGDFDPSNDTWNVSNVSNVFRMFMYAKSFNQDLNNWDTSKFSSLDDMFYKATSFNGEISNWQLEDVDRLNDTFHGATAFNQDISEWNIENVKDTSNIFKDAKSFNQDISEWDTSSVIDATNMFSGATAFNQDLGSWNVENLASATDMFKGVELSTDNYDSILLSWSEQDTQEYVLFHAGNSQFCEEEARLALISSLWDITDGGKDNDCPVEEPEEDTDDNTENTPQQTEVGDTNININIDIYNDEEDDDNYRANVSSSSNNPNRDPEVDVRFNLDGNASGNPNRVFSSATQTETNLLKDQCLVYDADYNKTYEDEESVPLYVEELSKLRIQNTQDQYVIEGNLNGEIKLQDNINRAEIVNILLRAHCLPILEASEIPDVTYTGKTLPTFTDLSKDGTSFEEEWLRNTLYSAAYYEVIEGNDDGTVDAARSVNAAEFYTILSRLSSVTESNVEGNTNLNNMSEVWYKAHIENLVSEGILEVENMENYDFSEYLSRDTVFETMLDSIKSRDLMM